jgi:enamine deaminase RidA (YjgF/YER057c/UK114 family)
MAIRKSYAPEGTEWMEEDFEMSPAIRAGDLVWLSGVTVFLEDGQLLEDAIDTAFSKIEKTLKSAGLDWNNVVDITSFHVDIAPQKELFLKIKSRYVTKKPYPAWTAVEVKGLWGPAILAEIKVVASAA